MANMSDILHMNKRTNSDVGVWKRLLAFLIDLMVINLVIIYPFRSIFIKYFSGLTLTQSLNSNNITIPSDAYFAMLIISVLALLYFTFFDYYLGQTPGKMLLKIKTISLAETSKSTSGINGISMSKALLRNCFILPFFPFYVFWFIEPIYLAFYKETLLEKITDTRTVHESERDNIKTYAREYKLDKV